MDGKGYLHTRKDKGRKKRKMAKKLFSLLMALTLLAALALPAAFAEDYLDIINIADDNQSASYDLHKDTSVNGRNMLRGTVMEQLVTLKADGSIAPELCESYDVSDDNSAFTFYLRKGVKFHNGKEMTSADVVASLNRWLECFGTARKMVGDARFTVVDDYTVSLTLDHSAIMLLDMLAGAAQAAVIYPVESIEAVNADTGYVPADYIIGTGRTCSRNGRLTSMCCWSASTIMRRTATRISPLTACGATSTRTPRR